MCFEMCVMFTHTRCTKKKNRTNKILISCFVYFSFLLLSYFSRFVRFNCIFVDDFTFCRIEFTFLGNKLEIKNHYRGHKLSMWLSLIPQLHMPGDLTELTMRHHHFAETDKRFYDGKFYISFYINYSFNLSLFTETEAKKKKNCFFFPSFRLSNKVIKFISIGIGAIRDQTIQIPLIIKSKSTSSVSSETLTSTQIPKSTENIRSSTTGNLGN